MAKRKPMADAAFDMLPFRTQVALFHDLKEMARYHEKVLGIRDHGLHDIASNGMASQKADGDGVHWFSLFLPDDAEPGLIVHECSHAVDLILDHHGVPLNVENTEVRAYMLQRLFEDVTAHFQSISTGA